MTDQKGESADIPLDSEVHTVYGPDGLSDSERELREQGLATGRPDLLDAYQRYLSRNPPPRQTGE